LNKYPIKHNQRVLGREGFKYAGLRLIEEFPDSRTEIDHIVAEGEKVLAMLTVTATGNETKNRVIIKSPDLYRIENGTITEHCDVGVNA
jgi:predicted ester cyclase